MYICNWRPLFISSSKKRQSHSSATYCQYSTVYASIPFSLFWTSFLSTSFPFYFYFSQFSVLLQFSSRCCVSVIGYRAGLSASKEMFPKPAAKISQMKDMKMKVSLRSTGELLPHPQELPRQVLSFLKRYPDTCGQGLRPDANPCWRHCCDIFAH